MTRKPLTFAPLPENLSHEQYKKLFMQKMIAISKKEYAFVNELKYYYPELFDKQFLYAMLQKELQETGMELPEEIHTLLQQALKSPYLQ